MNENTVNISERAKMRLINTENGLTDERSRATYIEALNLMLEYAIREGTLNEEELKRMIKDLNDKILTNSALCYGGVYRTANTRINGASCETSPVRRIGQDMDMLCSDIVNNWENLSPIELAAYAHARLTAIHPFPDGNGRTARLLMNYILIRNGYQPISISKENKKEYFEILRKFDECEIMGLPIKSRVENFAELISKLQRNNLNDEIIGITEAIKLKKEGEER